MLQLRFEFRKIQKRKVLSVYQYTDITLRYSRKAGTLVDLIPGQVYLINVTGDSESTYQLNP